MYKAHHWALYHMWFQNKSDLYIIYVNLTHLDLSENHLSNSMFIPVDRSDYVSDIQVTPRAFSHPAIAVILDTWE